MSEQFDLQVYYFSDANIKATFDEGFGKKIAWDIPLLEGYKHKFIKNWSLSKRLSNKFFQLFNPGVIGYLIKDTSPVIVLNGWSYSSDILTIITAKILRKKVWLRAENPLNQELRKSAFLLSLKRILFKLILFKFIDRFLYIGTESKDFFLYYGAKPKQLVHTPYGVDNDFFNTRHKALRNSKSQLLTKLKLPNDKRIVLFCGKYIEQKRPLDLLKAFSMIKETNLILVMVGEGPLRSKLELFIEEHKLYNVVLTGFVNQSQISDYYSIADVFVMCSGMGETWGLAINEAMNFHLPIVVTNTCGSSNDLVVNNVNGLIVEEGNIEGLSKAISTFINENELRKSAGEESARIVAHYSYDLVVKNMESSYAKND